MRTIDQLDLGTATSLPRSNGELVFEEPWESRAFAMAAALADRGFFDWADFQAGLIAAIAEHEKAGQASVVYRYYERWLSTLESLVVDRDLVSASDMHARLTALGLRPAGHDHAHHHEHR